MALASSGPMSGFEAGSASSSSYTPPISGDGIHVFPVNDQPTPQPVASGSSLPRCSVRGCANIVEPPSPSAVVPRNLKMCAACREKHRLYASSKRERRRAEKLLVISRLSAAAGTPLQEAVSEPIPWVNGQEAPPQSPDVHANAQDVPATAHYSQPVTNTDVDSSPSAPPGHWAIDPVLFSQPPPASTSSSTLANALILPPSIANASIVPPIASPTLTAPPAQVDASEINTPGTETTSGEGTLAAGQTRYCSVKGCKHIIPETIEVYGYKMCRSCRDRYRLYGVTKRAKWKREREVYDRELEALREKEDERRAANGLPLLSNSPADLEAWEQSLIDAQMDTPPTHQALARGPVPMPMPPLDPRYSRPLPESVELPIRMCSVSHCNKILPHSYRYKRCDTHRLQNRWHSQLKRSKEKIQKGFVAPDGTQLVQPGPFPKKPVDKEKIQKVTEPHTSDPDGDSNAEAAPVEPVAGASNSRWNPKDLTGCKEEGCSNLILPTTRWRTCNSCRSSKTAAQKARVANGLAFFSTNTSIMYPSPPGFGSAPGPSIPIVPIDSVAPPAVVGTYQAATHTSTASLLTADEHGEVENPPEAAVVESSAITTSVDAESRPVGIYPEYPRPTATAINAAASANIEPSSSSSSAPPVASASTSYSHTHQQLASTTASASTSASTSHSRPLAYPYALPLPPPPGPPGTVPYYIPPGYYVPPPGSAPSAGQQQYQYVYIPTPYPYAHAAAPTQAGAPLPLLPYYALPPPPPGYTYTLPHHHQHHPAIGAGAYSQTYPHAYASPSAIGTQTAAQNHASTAPAPIPAAPAQAMQPPPSTSPAAPKTPSQPQTQSHPIRAVTPPSDPPPKPAAQQEINSASAFVDIVGQQMPMYQHPPGVIPPSGSLPHLTPPGQSLQSAFIPSAAPLSQTHPYQFPSSIPASGQATEPQSSSVASSVASPMPNSQTRMHQLQRATPSPPPMPQSSLTTTTPTSLSKHGHEYVHYEFRNGVPFKVKRRRTDEGATPTPAPNYGQLLSFSPPEGENGRGPSTSVAVSPAAALATLGPSNHAPLPSFHLVAAQPPPPAPLHTEMPPTPVPDNDARPSLSPAPPASTSPRVCGSKTCHRILPSGAVSALCEKCRVKMKKRQVATKQRFRLEPKKAAVAGVVL